MTRGDHLVRWTTTASVVLLAAIAAIVSYRHMHTLVVRHGETPWTAAVLPLSVDGMIAASSMALLADSRHGRKSGILPWALLVAGSAASLAANIAVAEPTPVGRLIAAWPSFALIGSYELLMRQIRHSAHQTDDPQVSRETLTIRTPKPLPETIGSDDAHTSGVMTAKSPVGAQLNPTKGGPKSADAQVNSVSGRPISSETRLTHPIERTDSVPPDMREVDTRPRSRRQTADLQRRAWEWALANRGPYGQLPAGRKIAEQFGRKERWGRLVKNAGLAGSIQLPADPQEQNIAA